MHVPRTGHFQPPGFRKDWEFALCFKCHNRDELFNGGDPTTGYGPETNFRALSNGTPGVGGNPKPTVGYWYSMHDVHTWGANGPGTGEPPTGLESPQWDSDADGTADSRMTCPSCHNVHGSPSPAMIRHGELISKTPAFDFQYTPEGTYPSLSDSTGGITCPSLIGQGSVADNGVCNMCHSNRVTYARTALSALGPILSDMSPPNNAVNVPVDSELTFTLSDSYTGVDWSTFSIQLTGNLGYSNTYTDEDISVVTKTGTPASYNVTVNPDVDFGIGEVITVTVSIDDLAFPSHSMIRPPWSFKTAVSGSGTLILHPSGLNSITLGDFWTRNGSWATVLDSNDGDGSIAYKCSGPGYDTVYLNMDDPMGLAGATINSITIYVYARYLEGDWPDAAPYAGYIRIGYKTGTSTVWKNNNYIDDSGNYNLVASNTYTVDSDGGMLDLNDIMNLQTVVYRQTGGPRELRVTEVYVVIGYTF